MVSFTEFSAMFPGWQLVIFFFFLTLFLLSGGVTTFILMSKARWPIKVQLVVKKIGSRGSYISGYDRARVVGLLRTGEEIYYFKKRKKYRIGNEEYIGPKTMMWTRGKDGYWRNTSYDDVDIELKRLGLIPVSIEMREATALADEQLRTRHDPRSAFEKYGSIIIMVLLIVSIGVSGIMQWWSHHEANKSKATDLETAKVVKETVQLSNQALERINNLGGNIGNSPIPIS